MKELNSIVDIKRYAKTSIFSIIFAVSSSTAIAFDAPRVTGTVIGPPTPDCSITNNYTSLPIGEILASDLQNDNYEKPVEVAITIDPSEFNFAQCDYQLSTSVVGNVVDQATFEDPQVTALSGFTTLQIVFNETEVDSLATNYASTAAFTINVTITGTVL